MKFFKKLRKQQAVSIAATEQSQALLEKVARTEPEVDELHRQALKQLDVSATQARRLRAADYRNHYSEGLTKSFQERTA